VSVKAGSATVNKHVDALDGLRAIAILLVLMSHFTPGGDSNQGLQSLFFKIADIGWSGVDLFFVLSGYLITGILLKGKVEGKPIRHYLMRRILRILPAYYAALLFAFLLVPLATGIYPVPGFSVQAPYWLYLSNMFPESYQTLAGVFGMSHFWSLAVEMQFYALWPIVVYRLPVETAVKLCIAALALALAGRAVAVALDAHWSVTFGWMPFRMDGLIAGSIVAMAVRMRIEYAQVRPMLLGVIGLGLAIVAMVAWHDMASAIYKGRDYPATWLALRVSLPLGLALLFGALLWVSLQPNRLAGFLGNPFFTPLAKYSYGMYIIHFLLEPVFLQAFGPATLKTWTGGRELPVYLYFVLATGATYMLAMLSYHLIEQRFLLHKARF
jgi:peptidoglycan/LPS O-acetylase OafA/YrhL